MEAYAVSGLMRRDPTSLLMRWRKKEREIFFKRDLKFNFPLYCVVVDVVFANADAFNSHSAILPLAARELVDLSGLLNPFYSPLTLLIALLHS